MATVGTQHRMPHHTDSIGIVKNKRGGFRRYVSKGITVTGQSSRKLMLGGRGKNKNKDLDDGSSHHRSGSIASFGSQGSNHTDSGTRKVRFVTQGRSKKIKPEVIHFPKVDNNDDVWWTADEMFAIVEHAKHTVDDYAQNCERYIKVLDKVIQRCGSKSSNEPTVAFDMKVIKKFADAKARGLEHHVCPDIVHQRQKVIKSVMIAQRTLAKRSPEEREKVLAGRYASLSHGSKLLAKAMGDGDALVAEGL